MRELSSEEQAQLEAALRSADAFPVRRAQVLLASARKERVSRIARALGYSAQMVGNVIHAFNARGVESLVRESSRPKSSQPILDEVRREQLRRGRMVSLATETDRTLFFDFLPLDLGTISGFQTRFRTASPPTCGRSARWRGRPSSAPTLRKASESRRGRCCSSTPAP